MPILITIKVTPKTGRSAVSLDKAGTLKAFLKSAPEAGKANRELIKLLAHMLKCPQSAIEIVMGETARTKTLKIALNLSYEEILSKLGLAFQTNLPGT
jgi:uncharacterized protein